MSKNRLYAHVVLDRSGSMSVIQQQTIDAFNEYVQGLAADEKISGRLSLTIFDSNSIDLIRDNAKVKEMPKLTPVEYVPRGGTPLYDAIGKTVAKIDAGTRREGEQVVLVILTDGYENASREFNKSSIKALLDDRQKNKNWLVIYLGANQDALAEGAKFGTDAGNSMTFDPQAVSATMTATLRATSAKAYTGSNFAAAYTADERTAAIKK